MKANSADDAPLNLTIKVAGWTCMKRFAVSSPVSHYTSETGHDNSRDEDRDEEDEGDATMNPHTISIAGICEWEGCDQMFKGPDAPSLLYHHIVNEHIGKPGETKTFDSKCHWAACGYRGKIRRYLLSHIITHVPEYKPLACQDCGWRFQRISNLRMHHKSCRKK